MDPSIPSDCHKDDPDSASVLGAKLPTAAAGSGRGGRPALPPTPSGGDAQGRFFIRSDLEHPTKRKSDGSPTVSIKELPVGSRLRIDGPGPDDRPVYFTRTAGRPNQSVVWECSFPERHEVNTDDGSLVVTYGETSSHTVCGNNCSCNYQSLANLAQGQWKSTTIQKQEAKIAKKRKKQAASSAKKEKRIIAKQETRDGRDTASESRTLDDYKQGERFYKELCSERDEEIRTLKKALKGKPAGLY